MKFLKTILLFFYSFSLAHGQIVKENNYGVVAGFVISFGTHVNQFGVFIRTYYTYDRFQWNNDARVSIYFKNLGPTTPHPEFQISSGLLMGYGKKSSSENVFINKTSNQTNYENAVAYAFNAYFNNVKTSQQTGTVSFQWNHYYFNVENDLLAHARLDRFRTGALQVVYQKDNYRFAVSQVMWTGKLGKGIHDSNYPSPNGYLDTTNSVYPNLSHGLLYMSVENVDPVFQQQFRGAIGIDAEQVRYAVQNKFIHDELFLPPKWRDKNNCHFPMIDCQNQHYLFKPDQKIRKPIFYFNTFVNPDVI